MSIHKDHNREDPNVFETFETEQDRRYHDQLGPGPMDQEALDRQIHKLVETSLPESAPRPIVGIPRDGANQ